MRAGWNHIAIVVGMGVGGPIISYWIVHVIR